MTTNRFYVCSKDVKIHMGDKRAYVHLAKRSKNVEREITHVLIRSTHIDNELLSFLLLKYNPTEYASLNDVLLSYYVVYQ